jgi:hypothetical protein
MQNTEGIGSGLDVIGCASGLIGTTLLIDSFKSINQRPDQLKIRHLAPEYCLKRLLSLQ